MKTTIEAIIFDFNGTLFLDTDFHNQAWKKFALKYNKTLSTSDLEIYIHGKTNREILNFLFQKELDPAIINIYYEEKEELYREICLMNPDKCFLAPGAEDFLTFLGATPINKTIATASYKGNILFYNSLFNLERWFKIEDIIYDTGEYRGKPFPDMFLAASNRLNLPMSKCMVIEDSIGGIKAAINAGAGIIIAFSSSDNLDMYNQFDCIEQIVTDFRQIDKRYILS